MPRFKITTEIGRRRELHDEDLEFPHVEAARRDAQLALTEMCREGAPHHRSADFGVKLEDDSGKQVYRAALHFEEQLDDDGENPKEGTGSSGDQPL